MNLVVRAVAKPIELGRVDVGLKTSRFVVVPFTDEIILLIT